jgi:hypothetical protein
MYTLCGYDENCPPGETCAKLGASMICMKPDGASGGSSGGDSSVDSPSSSGSNGGALLDSSASSSGGFSGAPEGDAD